LDNTGSTCQQTQDNTDTKHTGNDAGMSTGRPESVIQQAWGAIRNSRLLAKFILILVLLLVVFIAWRAMKTPQWIFSIKAQTAIIELVTPDNGETRWRVNDAVICSRGALQADTGQASLPRVTDSSCGSRAWRGYRFPDPEQTLVLNGAFDVMLEVRRDGALFLALREPGIPPGQADAAAPGTSPPATAASPSQAKLTFTDGTPDIVLGRNGRLKINLLWDGADEQSTGFSGERVFPFSAATTIGRDVNWTGTSMLSSGNIQVYTADDSPDKRQMVDEAELLLGDQVRLETAIKDGGAIPPKGFIRYVPGSTVLDVIAFGAADHVRIERYGDNGYNFRPGNISKLLHDPLFIFVLTGFVSLIGLIGTIDALCKKD
jgi:hypothetical protein